ncbi:UNVERIFIED_CONTAM: hypothetical protein K2H54_056253 [Gekko kuhli]
MVQGGSECDQALAEGSGEGEPGCLDSASGVTEVALGAVPIVGPAGTEWTDGDPEWLSVVEAWEVDLRQLDLNLELLWAESRRTKPSPTVPL